MRVLAHVHDYDELNRLVTLMHDKGIPTYVRTLSTRGVERWILFVCLNSQARDAQIILRDPDHQPSQPVDVNTFERAAYSRGWNQMIKWGLLVLAFVVTAFGLIMYLIVKTGR